jgi:hypothetical protein
MDFTGNLVIFDIPENIIKAKMALAHVLSAKASSYLTLKQTKNYTLKLGIKEERRMIQGIPAVELNAVINIKEK